MLFQLQLLLTSLASALVLHHPRSTSQQTIPYEGHVITQFPKPTWIENIAVRKNGHLLLTLASIADLYTIDPLRPNSTQTLIHNFAPDTALLGITEVGPDQFFLIAGNFSLATFNPGIGSYSVWSVDLRKYNEKSNNGAIINQLATIPKASFLNGMSTLSVPQNLVVLADSLLGVVWLLNTHTGVSSILLQEPEMAPPSNSTDFPVGINGLRVLPLAGKDFAYVYFDNSDAAAFYRVPVSLSTLKKIGPVELLAEGIGADDFALDAESGYAYLAAGEINEIVRVPLEGGATGVTVFGGLNSTALPGPTSLVLGRGERERGAIYVTTNGALLKPVNGTFSEGGKVVAIDLGC